MPTQVDLERRTRRIIIWLGLDMRLEFALKVYELQKDEITINELLYQGPQHNITITCDEVNRNDREEKFTLNNRMKVIQAMMIVMMKPVLTLCLVIKEQFFM